MVNGNYKTDSDKIIQLTVAIGITSCILAFSFVDASRFLKSWLDRMFYLISCFLQKPILLPIFFPGLLFKSYIANNEKDGRSVYAIDDVEVTDFMLAVQETNFLYSFTLSALSALATALSSIDQVSEESIALISVSFLYSFFGIIISVYLYGRKTQLKDPERLNRDTILYKDNRAIP